MKRLYGIYEIEVKNQANEIVALFKEAVYSGGKEW